MMSSRFLFEISFKCTTFAFHRSRIEPSSASQWSVAESGATCCERRRRRRRASPSRPQVLRATAYSNDRSTAQPQPPSPIRTRSLCPSSLHHCGRTGRGCLCLCQPVDCDRVALAQPSWPPPLRKCARTCGDDRRDWRRNRNGEAAAREATTRQPLRWPLRRQPPRCSQSLLHR